MDTKYYITQETSSGEVPEISSLYKRRRIRKYCSDLSVSGQYNEAASKANGVLGIVRRQFRELDPQCFLIIYKELSGLTWNMPFVEKRHCSSIDKLVDF